MRALDTDEHLAAAIRNAAWMVRHYRRGARTRMQREERAQAIHELGLRVREAFNQSNHFELLLVAIVDGLRPLPDEPPF